ncbi:hypothetical protein DAERI_020107 [Deinococcus aerius]|uniref:Uncharacterized protein n=3 Tax=Deinococcus TaxID=1298 RepID=A0A2I9D2Z7_9DEIO|nr:MULTISPECIES: hypothetical protein [Deinococcus]ABW35043.1 hypothetical protein Dgeo_3002 [Deinococcus geothermalis DSM 11300]MBB5293610.1 hypothetical protein [Deinococcus metallilatus]QBY07406.1 hypothetical protein E5F05_05395 [Deinococcus metallilatus]RXJ14879.1 hypothetical protein ERJ73_04115 [Deinococcus metallilatus]TLK31000.1 hypothetical protein FCS05_04430 [Deinococcus metallilatus]
MHAPRLLLLTAIGLVAALVGYGWLKVSAAPPPATAAPRPVAVFIQRPFPVGQASSSATRLNEENDDGRHGEGHDD